jgi:hypothetical protein
MAAAKQAAAQGSATYKTREPDVSIRPIAASSIRIASISGITRVRYIRRIRRLLIPVSRVYVTSLPVRAN